MSWVPHCYSELIKVHCRSQSFHAASRAVKFLTTIYSFFLDTAVKTMNRSPRFRSLTLIAFLI